ncbi:MAG: zinc ribbon domain-containing protein [Blautia sp.]|uniref:zinc ribbon domain-containing protein n=1 Tax=Blautia TaxID=572511 RepID=UPI00259095C4|nr:zinc ribbon domain-containing protein [Blautia sp.]MCI7289494.1 zinc ribbon domain-containing protein [Blautia sp.]MDY2753495.1 zinc ribbon domain-containing protein [Blautia obeum]
MAKDFFGSLGETLTKTAKELSGRAEEVYETQRLKNKISGEERQIEKAMADLGRIIYKRYKKEIPVDDAQKALCEQIDQRMEQIEKYKTDISELKVKNKRFCPSCGSPLAKDDAFCSQCGAACPTVEPEEDAGDDVIEGTAEEVAEETATEETDETVEEAAEAEEAAQTDAEEQTEAEGEKEE